jgi:hypothetical protein
MFASVMKWIENRVAVELSLSLFLCDGTSLENMFFLFFLVEITRYGCMIIFGWKIRLVHTPLCALSATDFESEKKI